MPSAASLRQCFCHTHFFPDDRTLGARALFPPRLPFLIKLVVARSPHKCMRTIDNFISEYVCTYVYIKHNVDHTLHEKMQHASAVDRAPFLCHRYSDETLYIVSYHTSLNMYGTVGPYLMTFYHLHKVAIINRTTPASLTLAETNVCTLHSSHSAAATHTTPSRSSLSSMTLAIPTHTTAG